MQKKMNQQWQKNKSSLFVLIWYLLSKDCAKLQYMHYIINTSIYLGFDFWSKCWGEGVRFFHWNTFISVHECYILTINFLYTLYTLEVVKQFVWWVVVVCKPILVFSFGPNQALGLRLRLWPSRTTCYSVH